MCYDHIPVITSRCFTECSVNHSGAALSYYVISASGTNKITSCFVTQGKGGLSGLTFPLLFTQCR